MSEGISQVHPQLWIANITAARTSDMSKFDAVITVCQDSIEDHIPDEIMYYSFNMSDGPGGGRGRCDYEYFQYAARVVEAHLDQGDNVLVHCHAGQSRSPSVSIAGLAAHEGTTYRDMYRLVDEARPQIMPDSTLEAHAKEYLGENPDGVAGRMRERAEERVNDADE